MNSVSDNGLVTEQHYNLPIHSIVAQLRATLVATRNVVLQAPPGAGKSTGVPLALLAEPWLQNHKMVMLEPRRLAARAVAARMARMLGEPVGRTVGYRTRLDSNVSSSTRIEVVTEGILTRWLQHDAALAGVALIIFDEFHERSLNADLGLALCLDAQQNLREDLKILVMSATLDGTAVAGLLGDAPILSATGRAFAVQTIYRRAPAVRSTGVNRWAEDDVVALTVATIREALQAQEGDMLVFLPGQGEIHRAQRLLEDAALPSGTNVLPLYGELAIEQQDAAIQPAIPGTRKIVLATNIAETSLTIEGVRVVIDSGLARSARFDPATGMSRLETSRISRASAQQRAGRAGRVAPGVCYRLWSETQQASLSAFTAAEIVAADLAALALELANWGIADPHALRWLDLPPAAAFAQARDLLHALDALGKDSRITPHGRAMARIGAHPRLAHMILRGSERGFTRLALQIAALLGERDLLRSDSAARSIDLRIRVEALNGDPFQSSDIVIDTAARQRVRRSVELLARQIENRNPSSPVSAEDTGQLLALAYPDRIAQSRGSGGRYLLASGRGARLTNIQSLAQQEFLVIAALDGGEREATIRLAAPITRATLESELRHRIEERERIEWDSREQLVIAQRERWLDAIRLEQRRIEHADGACVTQAMLTGIRELGIAQLPWTKQARALQARIDFAHRLDSRVDRRWPAADDTTLLIELEQWLAPWLQGISRRDHLPRLDLHAILLALLDWHQQQQLDLFAPAHLLVPSGSTIPIDYGSDAPTVAVRLQEIFGLQLTPTVAEGRVPLTLQLLSPAHRPVQVTRDLASFWARGYLEVKKELKGRYPKHSWPDDPLTAPATAKARRKQ